MVTTTGKAALEKPANASYAGIWDQPVNQNFDEIDAAISGVSVVNLSAGNLTLSTAQARAAVIVFQGAPANDVVVTMPVGVTGVWTCYNGISTGKNITLQAAGGATLTLGPSTAGRSTTVWCDTTNVLLSDNGFYLSASGGVMTGGLTLPANGLSVGGNQLYVSGNNVGISGSLYVAGDISGLSDRRVKGNVRPITEALDLVNRLDGVRYADAHGRERVGVIAQEVMDVVPEVVSQHPETGLYSVAYGNLVGVLIEAIKELSARVDELEALR